MTQVDHWCVRMMMENNAWLVLSAGVWVVLPRVYQESTPM